MSETITEEPMSPNPKQAARSAAITGAGSGLGRDIALGLAERGYAVFGTAITEAEVQETLSSLHGRVAARRVTPPGALWRPADRQSRILPKRSRRRDARLPARSSSSRRFEVDAGS